MENMITLSMVVRNEGKALEKCLEDIYGHVDEIVVVDQSSTDSTMDIAKKFTKRIYIRPQSGFADTDRQFSIDLASSPWVLVLDPDECLDQKLKQNLRQLTCSEYEAFWIPRKNFIEGRLFEKAGDDLQLRFFKKHVVNWPPVVHAYPILHTRKVGRVNNAYIIHSRTYERLKQVHLERNLYVDERVKNRQDAFLQEVEAWLYREKSRLSSSSHQNTLEAASASSRAHDLQEKIRHLEEKNPYMTDEEAHYRLLHELAKTV